MSKPMVYGVDRVLETLDSGIYRNYDYIILSLGTHPCAYVRIPKTHKYFEEHYDNIDIDCHGGLTYSSKMVTNAKKSGWWIGWDYAHLGDFTGYDMRSGLGDPGDYEWSTPEIISEVHDVINQLKDNS